MLSEFKCAVVNRLSVSWSLVRHWFVLKANTDASLCWSVNKVQVFTNEGWYTGVCDGWKLSEG